MVAAGPSSGRPWYPPGPAEHPYTGDPPHPGAPNPPIVSFLPVGTPKSSPGGGKHQTPRPRQTGPKPLARICTDKQQIHTPSLGLLCALYLHTPHSEVLGEARVKSQATRGPPLATRLGWGKGIAVWSVCQNPVCPSNCSRRGLLSSQGSEGDLPGEGARDGEGGLVARGKWEWREEAGWAGVPDTPGSHRFLIQAARVSVPMCELVTNGCHYVGVTVCGGGGGWRGSGGT